MTHSSFNLHPKLQQDTFFIKDIKISQCLLMNDKRFPWLILVPQKSDVIELFDLGYDEQILLLEEINKTSQYLSRYLRADKINIAALGNIVPQFHVHIIARYKTDTAWPSPVFGFGKAEPYNETEKNDLIKKLIAYFE